MMRMAAFHGVARLFALLLLLALHPLANAAANDAGLQRVEKFLSGLQGLQARFHQTLADSKGGVTSESNGTLAISRPNRFRWDYTDPYKQLIVSDGSRIWLYDTDLEQVTVRQLDDSISATPAMLLSGQGNLSDNFTVTQTVQDGGTQWVQLEPKRSDTDFKWVRLGFAGEELKYMQLGDKLGQKTLLAFNQFERNPKLDPARFTFTVPPGADVIGDASSAAPAKKP
jgi:outer membrane lipoprotein carrier protein